MSNPAVTREQVAGWLNLQQVNRVLENLVERRLREATDLSTAEFELLYRLDVVAGHPLQMSQIAAQLINSPSGATRLADRLEAAGLIVRETPKDNRRVVEVRLTDHGKGLLRRADRVFKDVLQETFASHLTDAELTTLRALMRRLLEKNGAWSDARCSPGA